MKRSFLAAVAFVFVAASFANATSIPLGSSGWQVVWDSGLNPYLNITVEGEDADAVYIHKTVEFIQGPDEFGNFPTIPITFWQIGPSTITKIVILDETIKNSTGANWTDFHWDLIDHGEAWFIHDPGWFFKTSPLDNQSWARDDMNFSVDGFATNGVVYNGSVWQPGIGVDGGELVIHVTSKPAAPYTLFTLKETPTPEPASLLLLVVGAMMLRRR